MSAALSQPWPDRPDLKTEGLSLLAQMVLAMRSTGDPSAAGGIAGTSAVQALGASEYGLLRVERRSGALFRVEDAGVESPYLPEPGGVVEWVMEQETALFDDGLAGDERPREPLLWTEPCRAVAVLPLHSGSLAFGFLLVSFDAPRTFEPEERQFLQALSDVLALTCERAELRRNLDSSRHHVGEMERRLNHLEESSTSLMGAVAQEIRSPLSAIKAYNESLLDSQSDAPAHREKVSATIDEECDRLAQLVTDILDLSRLESGQCPLRLSVFEPESVIRDVVLRLTPSTHERRIRWDLEIGAGLRVEADRDLVARMFGSLLGYAVCVSPREAHIRLSAVVRGEEWVVTIEDHGPPVRPDERVRVFDRFARLRSGSDPQREGNGLALPIVRGIVELHGGRAWVESPAAGGARFCLALPLRHMAPERARRIARTLCGRPDLRELYDQTIDLVSAALGAEIVSLMLVDPDRGDLFVAASRGLPALGAGKLRTAIRTGVAGTVTTWGRPLLVRNIELDRRFRRINHPQYRTKSLLCVPIRIEGEVLGVVNANNKSSGEPFDEDDLAVLAGLVERVASAVERACAYPDSPRVVREAVEAIKLLTRHKHNRALDSASLVRRVRACARALSMSPPDVDLLGYVASIHDLGMTPMRGRFDERQPLDDAQRAALSTHPMAGYEMLRPLEFLGTVRELILSHHERWDGTGYPRGLKGMEIPLGGRILAVADAFESMVSGRLHRAPLGREQAIEELRLQSSRQFDPDVVEAFVRILATEPARS